MRVKPRYASFRNRLGASQAELSHTPMPEAHQRPIRPSLMGQSGGGKSDSAAARGSTVRDPHSAASEAQRVARLSGRYAQVEWPEGAPPGPIAIAQLFLPGQYDDVQEWFGSATSAMRQLRQQHRSADRSKPAKKQRRVRGPPTLVKHQSALQPWARGIVWDLSLIHI